MRRLLLFLALSIVLVLAACSSEGAGDGEFPSKTIEIVAPASPGGGYDATSRAIQKIMTDEKLVEQNITVVNKPGGNGEVGWKYLQPKDGHSIAIDSSLIVTNNILGTSDMTFEDVTPLATLTTEWISYAVPPDSPFKDAQEFMEQLKEDPASLKIAVAPGLGNNDHLSFVEAAKTYGVDVTKLNFLVYDGGGDVVTALLGGHVDFGISSLSEFKDQHEAEKFRIVAVSSEERIEGLEDVGTWKEQGVDMVFPHWRGIVGPADMSDEEIAYWDDVISKLVETEAWQTLLKNNEWEPYYKDSKETIEFLKEQQEKYEVLIKDSGLID
ncbi:tripartite tricarboxylate transporter substrate binding protein [Sporosarcina pasteurii]|uniref:Tripartite tricarboxylate transporter family receptor n=1 Tax=Sporosarcina pasteurii TaxID=1474 RepID=A0A380BCW2_SPOPA|nr:tripartite tricarboxylate transporter substrate binding protein [Sporosarcina pasteurii]MDS9472616.1 tripartite tricarboxylate transporter substrate binding protein [Sporosarcina pasteurii]QBQ06162.1 tripartite tricarboxylate transporter substrate binding protein [Sporosarcina pasteurii]SUI99295.1 Tripartite tricarboxylate transporter family receptor [Sporosarcina pasteurii]